MAAAMAVLVVGLASAAWACTPAASNVQVVPEFGAPGTEATVTGQYFTPTVEIRWGSATGPVLARVAGPSFSAPVRIPAGDAGGYALFALGLNEDGTVAGQAAVGFRIPGAPVPASAAPAPAPAPSATGPSPAAASSPAPAGTEAPTGGITWPAGTPRDAAKEQAAAVASPPTRPRAAVPAVTAPVGSHLLASTPAGPAPLAAPVVAAGPAPVPAAAPAPTPAVEPLKPGWQQSPAQPVGLLSDVPASHGSSAGVAVALSLVGVSGLFGGGFAFLTMARRRRPARATKR